MNIRNSAIFPILPLHTYAYGLSLCVCFGFFFLSTTLFDFNQWRWKCHLNLNSQLKIIYLYFHFPFIWHCLSKFIAKSVEKMFVYIQRYPLSASFCSILRNVRRKVSFSSRHFVSVCYDTRTKKYVMFMCKNYVTPSISSMKLKQAHSKSHHVR